MEAASIGAFKDPREQVECSVCHKTAKYGDVMRYTRVTERDSVWGVTNEGVFTCPDCVKKALGPENWERVRVELEACGGGPPVKNHQVCEKK